MEDHFETGGLGNNGTAVLGLKNSAGLVGFLLFVGILTRTHEAFGTTSGRACFFGELIQSCGAVVFTG